MPNRFLRKTVPTFRFETDRDSMAPIAVLCHNEVYEIRAGRLYSAQSGRCLGTLTEVPADDFAGLGTPA